MNKQRERRHYPRYAATRLSLWVMRSDDKDELRRPDKVNAIDYNSRGVGFYFPQEFVVGERLILDMALGKVRVSGVLGTVRHSADGRCGVLFDLPEGGQILEQLDGFEEIERLLK